MMKKTLPLIALLALCTMVAAPPAQALNVIINQDGTMTFMQGQVLGEDSAEDKNETEDKNEDANDDSRETEKKETEVRLEMEKKTQERAIENAKKTSEQNREQLKQKTEQAREAQKKLRTVQTRENQQLKVKTQNQKTEMILEQKREQKENEPEVEDRFRKQERIEAENFDIQMPATVKNDDDSQAPEDGVTRRQGRTDSMRIRTAINDEGESETEIEAGSIKAKLKASEFSIDPETNVVTLTTPNGTTHQLTHLPDQALQQMEQAGLLTANDPQAELSIETNDDGQVTYKTKVTRQMRFLGLVPYNVEQEAELEDTTGETTLTPTNQSFLNRVRYMLSR